MPIAIDRTSMPRKATAIEMEKGQTALAERAPRPLYAMLRASVEAQPPMQGAAAKSNGGRWKLNAGSMMVTCVWGLNMVMGDWGPTPDPVRLVVDLGSARFDKPTMPALGEHWWDKIIGRWSGGAITDKGVDADLTIYEARTPAEAVVLPEAIRAKALLEQGHPWQASIGAYPEDGLDGYEEVESGDSVEVNGVTLAADDSEFPLYVMRKAVITEASICTFGADDETGPMAVSARRRGRLAASASNPSPSKESPAMKYNLRAMLTMFAAHALLVAEHVAAAQELPEDKQPTQEVLQAQIADAVGKAELAAAKAEIAALKAAAEAKAKETPTKVVKATGRGAPAPSFQGSAGEQEGDAPPTLHQAMTQLNGEKPALKGFKLRAAALQRWPELRKTIPDAMAGAR